MPGHYPGIELDEFIIMPNHVHGVIFIYNNDVGATHESTTTVGAGLRPAPIQGKMVKRYPLSEIVRAFKSFSARQINELRNTPSTTVWQRNYYEHIIRNERALNRIREYVHYNPVRWELDRENDLHVGADEFDAWLASEGKTKIKNKGDSKSRPYAS